jgi:C1A family cysteine protease
MRRSIFESEKLNVEKHNALYAAGESTYWLKLNAFSDLTNEEWRTSFLMSQKYVDQSAQSRKQNDDAAAAAASTSKWRFEHTEVTDGTSIDWRDHGVVGAVQNQGSCGSCWAFAGMGAAASTVAIKKGVNTSSEYQYGSVQEVLDCCPYGDATYDCWSCDGGEPVTMMGWLADKSHGFDTQDDWPYISGSCGGGQCYTCDETKLEDPASNVMSIDGGERPPQNNETALMQALMTRPVSIDIDVEGSFRSYGGGIFTDAACGETIWHAVLLVGFNYAGSDDLADSYFIMQNSWGTSWGDAGYMLMGMGVDAPHGVCCLACYPAIALLDDE